MVEGIGIDCIASQSPGYIIHSIIINIVIYSVGLEDTTVLIVTCPGIRDGKFHGKNGLLKAR